MFTNSKEYSKVQKRSEKLIKKKISALLKNLQLETIPEHYSADEISEHEDLSSFSSSVRNPHKDDIVPFSSKEPPCNCGKNTSQTFT